MELILLWTLFPLLSILEKTKHSVSMARRSECCVCTGATPELSLKQLCPQHLAWLWNHPEKVFLRWSHCFISFQWNPTGFSLHCYWQRCIVFILIAASWCLKVRRGRVTTSAQRATGRQDAHLLRPAQREAQPCSPAQRASRSHFTGGITPYRIRPLDPHPISRKQQNLHKVVSETLRVNLGVNYHGIAQYYLMRSAQEWEALTPWRESERLAPATDWLFVWALVTHVKQMPLAPHHTSGSEVLVSPRGAWTLPQPQLESEEAERGRTTPRQLPLGQRDASGSPRGRICAAWGSRAALASALPARGGVVAELHEGEVFLPLLTLCPRTKPLKDGNQGLERMQQIKSPNPNWCVRLM